MLQKFIFIAALAFCSPFVSLCQDFSKDIQAEMDIIEKDSNMIVSYRTFNRFFEKKSATFLGLDISKGFSKGFFTADLAKEEFSLGYNSSRNDENGKAQVYSIGISFDGDEELGKLYSNSKWNEKFTLDIGALFFLNKSVFFNTSERKLNKIDNVSQKNLMNCRRRLEFARLKAELDDELGLMNDTRVNCSNDPSLTKSSHEKAIAEWYENELKGFELKDAFNLYTVMWISLNGKIQTSEKKYNLIDTLSFKTSITPQIIGSLNADWNYYREGARNSYFISLGIGALSQNVIELIGLNSVKLGEYLYTSSSVDSLRAGTKLDLLNNEDENKKVFILDRISPRSSLSGRLQLVYLRRPNDWKTKLGGSAVFNYYHQEIYRRLDLELGIPIVLSGKDDEVVNIQIKGIFTDLFNQSSALTELANAKLYSRKNDKFQLGVSVGVPFGRGVLK